MSHRNRSLFRATEGTSWVRTGTMGKYTRVFVLRYKTTQYMLTKEYENKKCYPELIRVFYKHEIDDEEVIND